MIMRRDGGRDGDGGTGKASEIGDSGDSGKVVEAALDELYVTPLPAFVSRREEIQTQARHIRVHGSDRRYYHDIIGGNFRMDGFQGALLNVKLPHLAAWTARRSSSGFSPAPAGRPSRSSAGWRTSS